MTDPVNPPGLGRLWAGWRGEYVVAASAEEQRDAGKGIAAEAGERCVFCRILASGMPDEDTHVLRRGTHVMAILNAYPYSSGHLMVIPYRHVGEVESLTDDEHTELWAFVTQSVRALKTVYSPDGINLGANLGRAAGAGVPGHLHLHVVPRWNGDTNFMTAVAEVRVMPEPLASSAIRLRAVWPIG